MPSTTEAPTSDLQLIDWAARECGISVATAYRLAQTGQLPGARKIGSQWRISVPAFRAAVHGQPA